MAQEQEAQGELRAAASEVSLETAVRALRARWDGGERALSSVDLRQVEQTLERATYSTTGYEVVTDWLFECRNAELKGVLLDVLGSLFQRGARAQFSLGEASYLFPDAFLEFGLDLGDAMSVPAFELGSLRGYTFAVMANFDPVPEHVALENAHFEQRRTLYQFLSASGHGTEAVLQLAPPNQDTQHVLRVRSRSLGDKEWREVRWELPHGCIAHHQWHHIVVAHSQPYLASSGLTVFVDGVERGTEQLQYPKMDQLASRNLMGQGLGGRMASPTLFEGAASVEQVIEMYLGHPRMRTAIPNPSSTLSQNRIHTSRKRTRTVIPGPLGSARGSGPAGDAPTEPLTPQLSRRFALTRVGHVTSEGIAELRSTVKDLLKMTSSSARQLAARRLQLSANDGAKSCSPGGASLPKAPRYHQYQLGVHHRYDDLAIVFTYDIRTCIGDDLKDHVNGLQVRIQGGVLETLSVNGKRVLSRSGEQVIEPRAIAFAKNKASSAGAAAAASGTRRVASGKALFARCLGQATAVLDKHPHPSFESTGAVLPLIAALVSMLPDYVREEHELHLPRKNTFPQALDAGFSTTLAKLIRAIGEMIYAREIYRDSFVRAGGFGLIAWILQKLPRHTIDIHVAKAAWEMVVQVGYVDPSLRCEGLVLVIFDHRVWGATEEATQSYWVQRLLDFVQTHPLESRLVVGVQCALDLLAVTQLSQEKPPPSASFKEATRHPAPPARKAPPAPLVISTSVVHGEHQGVQEEALKTVFNQGNADSDESGDSGLDDDDEEEAEAEEEEEEESSCWICRSCIEPLVLTIRRMIESRSLRSGDPFSPSVGATSPGFQMDPKSPGAFPRVDEDDPVGFSSSAKGAADPRSPNTGDSELDQIMNINGSTEAHFNPEPGPTSSEVLAILNFVGRYPRAPASSGLVELLSTMLLPLIVKTQPWDLSESQIASQTYAALQQTGGVDVLLALASRANETNMSTTASPPGSHGGSGSFKLLTRIAGGKISSKPSNVGAGGTSENTEPSPASPPTIGTVSPVPPVPPVTPSGGSSASTDTRATTGKSQRAGLDSPPTSKQSTASVFTIKQSHNARKLDKYGLLSSQNGVPARTRAAMLLLVGRVILLQETIEVAGMIRENAGNPSQQESIRAVNKSRRQKQFGVILRSLMHVQHVATFRLEDAEIRKVSKDVHPSVLDAMMSVVLGGAAQREDIDDFVPHDDTMRLALPDALPVLGGMLSALSLADEETKAIAAREILLKLSLVLKASEAAREQVTTLPRWQTWLIPVMLLHENSLNHHDDQSADYLLGEVATDLLCTLMEHETQRPDDSHVEAKKLNRVQHGWAAWQGLAESALRILKEKERGAIADEVERLKLDSEDRFLIPEYNAVAELRATHMTARVLRQTLERVWERLVVRFKAGGLHSDAVRNFLMTIAMAEEVLLDPINKLRLVPLSAGGIIASSSALTYMCPNPIGQHGSASTPPPLSCGARCVIDQKRGTKWVDLAASESGNDGATGFATSAQSWISYRYPSFGFLSSDERIVQTRHRIVFYVVRSAFDMPELDPSGWTLFGRTTEPGEAQPKGWVVLDRRSEIRFGTRYSPIHCWVQQSGFFDEYKIVFDPPARRGKILKDLDNEKVYAKLHVGEVTFFECDTEHWHHDAGSTAESDPEWREAVLVSNALGRNKGELSRFVKLALQTVQFIRSGSAVLESPRRYTGKSGRMEQETEASGQVHNLPKRATVRFLGHLLRNAAHLELHLLEDAVSVSRSYLADDLGANSPGNRTLVLILVHALHHAVSEVRAGVTKLVADDPKAVDAEAKLAVLEACVSTILSNFGHLVPQGARAEDAAASRSAAALQQGNLDMGYADVLLQHWHTVWGPLAFRALERELESEALNRHVSFRVERSSSTAMAKRANPVEVAAYGAGRGQRPIGLPKSTKKRLRLMLSHDDERIYTQKVSRMTLQVQMERGIRKLLERDELLRDVVYRKHAHAFRHLLYRLGPFVDPRLRVATQLIRNHNGDPHLGASSGIADRLKRKQILDDLANPESLAAVDEAVNVADVDPVASAVGLAGADASPQQESSGKHTWENIGAKLSKQISIADMSLMTRAEEEEEEEEEAGGADEDDEDAKTDAGCSNSGAPTNSPEETDRTRPTTLQSALVSSLRQFKTSKSKSKDEVDDSSTKDSQGTSAKAPKKTPSAPSVHFGQLNEVRNEKALSVETETSTASTGIASLHSASTPDTPLDNVESVPTTVEQYRKLTLEEWVNRSPDPIRGETKEPWPAQGEVVLSASRCFQVKADHEIPGRLIVSQESIYFDPDPPDAQTMYIMRPKDFQGDERSAHDSAFEGANEQRWNNELAPGIVAIQMSAKARFDLEQNKRRHRKVWSLGDVDRILLRRYRMRDSAIELFVKGNMHESFLFDFDPLISCTPFETKDRDLDVRENQVQTSNKVRNSVMNRLWSVLPTAVRKRSQKPGDSVRRLVQRYTEKWRNRALSNFEYLIRLNFLAGRSVNDLTQYPVFPWVLADYESESLDLSNPASFRDLSKPMGALTEDRLAEVRERYQSFVDPDTPKFHYGSHYSTMAGVVLYYLVRMEPFTSLHIKMQDGHFDVPDRLFNSVAGTWRMCTTAMSEVKELTPEFYCLPDFLVNHNSFDLGTSQDGHSIGDVELPPWAQGSPHRFVATMREALESEHVSQHLHQWIDLIFGFKARLPDAASADNVFYYLTYPGAVDMDAIQDPAMRLATELQIKHFGQCPVQIFSRPHPPRRGPPSPPYPLGMILNETHADDVFNEHGMHTCLISGEGGSILGVRLLENRAITIAANGDMCSYIWGRPEDHDVRRDSNATEHEEDDEEHDDEEAANADAASGGSSAPSLTVDSPKPEAERRKSRSESAMGLAAHNGTTPLVLLPSPESAEARTQDGIADADVQHHPVHTLPLNSLRRQMMWSKSPEGVERFHQAVVAWSRDGHILVHATQGVGTMEVCFIDTTSGYLRAWSATVCAHAVDISALAVNGSTAVSGALDGSLRVWDLLDSSGFASQWGVSAAPRLSLLGHTEAVSSISVSESQGLIVSVSSDHALLHSLNTGRLSGAFEPAGTEGVLLARISDRSGKVVLYTKAQKIHLYATSRADAPIACVDAQQVIFDMVFTKQDFNSHATELLLCAGDGGKIVSRAVEQRLSVKGAFSVWPSAVTGAAIQSHNKGPTFRSLSLNQSEEALLVGASDGSLCLLPLPNFISSGPHVKIPVVGAMDVNAKLQSAKSAVLNKIETTRVFATARGVASEAVGVASKLAKGFQSVFGGGGAAAAAAGRPATSKPPNS
ncbi:BEACH domain-containing protein B (BEACH-domain homolog B) [Durusdinium trenchii]|uniref:BEACH domain-containing protein B (BEACH-domain homolog B) n=1 Tax=Durusdinium trenchii TaxID=1381693 RepID=A0ABP0H8T5_9DINO